MKADHQKRHINSIPWRIQAAMQKVRVEKINDLNIPNALPKWWKRIQNCPANVISSLSMLKKRMFQQLFSTWTFGWVFYQTHCYHLFKCLQTKIFSLVTLHRSQVKHVTTECSLLLRIFCPFHNQSQVVHFEESLEVPIKMNNRVLIHNQTVF